MEITASLNVSIMIPIERTFKCSDGIEVAAQYYPASKGGAQKIVMLHGWLDNCRTFWKLAPALNESSGAEIVALDVPGHGKSGHKSKDGPPAVLPEACFYLADVVRQLEWKSFCLVGHSMGAAIAVMYASAFPDQVTRLVVVEGAGPVTKPARHTSKSIRSHVEGRLKFLTSPPHGPRVYPSLDAAVDTRLETVAKFPGNQTLSREAAKEMVSRAVVPQETDDGSVVFSHDPRLHLRSILFMSNEQVAALQRDVQCPVLVVLGKNGFPFDDEWLDRMQENLRPQTVVKLPGSHHLHADPETADAVTETVKQFLL